VTGFKEAANMSTTDAALVRNSGLAPALDRLRAFAIALILPLTLLLLWSIGSQRGWLPEQILPSPAYVWQNFVEMIGNGDLVKNASISAVRVSIGFVIGAGLELALGIAMGLSETVDDYVRPLFTAVAQVPTIGWIPLLMLFLGIGETPSASP
jgi:sulfonate transport system permease protein